MLTTWPRFAASMWGSTAPVAFTVPLQLTSIVRSHCSYLAFFISVKYMTPAQLTRRSTRPLSPITVATAAWISARSVTSAAIAVAPGSADAGVMDRDTCTTVIPRPSNASATARPMPDDAPVTIATWPLRSAILTSR
jgi:hypothetical protein